MSVAALEALTLRRHLQAGTGPQPHRFFADLARVVDVPWDIAAGGDLAFPGIQGRRTAKVRLITAYLARLHAAAAHDASLAGAFLRVAGLVAPPQSLLHPGVAARVLRGSLQPATAGTVVSSSRDAPQAAPGVEDSGDISPSRKLLIDPRRAGGRGR
jgi:hypothetical protein